MRMESNVRTIRWIIQLKSKFTQRYMSPRLTLLLSYDMRKRQIYKIINISSHSASLHIIGDSNFESELEGRIQSVNQTHWKLRVKTLIDQFSSWNYEKHRWSYKYFNSYVAWQAVILAKCGYIFFVAALLKM